MAEPAGGIAWWWLIPAVLAGAAATLFLLARTRSGRPPAAAEHEPEPAEVLPRRAPPAAGPAAAPPVPAPQPALQPAEPLPPIPAPAPATDPFLIALEPVRLSVSLVNATLHYELSVTNRSAEPLPPVALAADMIGAHASLSDDNQLARDGTGLELRHELPALGPGETARAKGELRLPLASVTPIRNGEATLLVPLVRLRAESGPWSARRAMVVGESPLAPGGRLRPFRLDTGPRIFGEVSQREIADAA